jgi:hypothetical protein
MSVKIYKPVVHNKAGWRGKAEHISSIQFLGALMRSEYAARHCRLYCGPYEYIKQQKSYLWLPFNIRIMYTKHCFKVSICVLYEHVMIMNIFKFTCFSEGEGGGSKILSAARLYSTEW